MNTNIYWFAMSLALIILWGIFSKVHGRRQDDWNDRKIFVPVFPSKQHDIACNSYHASLQNISDESDEVFSIPNNTTGTVDSKLSSTLITPTSIMNVDGLSNDIDISCNSPGTTNTIMKNADASDLSINSSIDIDDDDMKPLEEETVIRLKYRNNNFINENTDEDDTLLLKTRSSSSGSDAIVFPPLQTPIVYRYYPRHQSRTISAGSVPFVLLGPNVDHWKQVAQQLSLRGFNVIAVGPKDQVLPTTISVTTTSSATKTKPSYELGLSSAGVASSNDSISDRYLEGPALVLQLLDALRWKKIILVGCDSESALAIQAALLLPSDRIAGLILCGNIQESETTFLEYSSYRGGPFELDRFLHERLSCPFTIVWDGTHEKAAISSTTPTLDMSFKPIASGSGSVSSHRSVIIGGGTSPHRRRPGIFAWILTRFVEERVVPAVSIQSPTSSTAAGVAVRRTIASRIPSSTKDTIPSLSVLPMWLSSSPLWKIPARIPVLWNVDDMFNEESMVVFGRIVATAIFYAISLKVLVYQYGNIRDIIDIVTSTPRLIISMIRNRISNVVTLMLFVGRLPFVLLPFGKRIAHGNEIGTGNEAMVSSSNGKQEEQIHETENSKDEKDKSEPSTDNDLRPFFFLDHVVA